MVEVWNISILNHIEQVHESIEELERARCLRRYHVYKEIWEAAVGDV